MTSLDEDDRRLAGATIERLAAQYFSIERCRSGDLVCDSVEWTSFGDQGLFAIGISPEYGGIGGAAGDLAMVMRQVGLNLLPLPYMDSVVIGATIVARLGSEEQKQQLLPAIAAGQLRLGFAHREASSGDVPDHVDARVSGGRISGQKIHVMDGMMAAKLIVSARDEQGVLGFYLVDRDDPGAAFQHYRLIDNRMASRVTLADAQCVAIGGDASETLAVVLDLAGVCAAAETAGAVTGLNRDTLEYAKVRKQFGKSIGSFQVLQHRLVDMFIAETMASALVIDALAAFDDSASDAPMRISAAKAQADRSGRQVGESAIQIHGGIGMTDECSVGHYLKRILANGSQFGTAGWHVARIAQNAL
ncbi:acyl-CoA dehydrogenase family protein [Sphingobium sp.]|uniref:acyl-CoA dehydrogenase family protein n=1 Tax=Sphingobium sp. TaxID=1912891 RepID=UPI0028BDCF94|nr:acyl-CoA dehydrogenase family protein [Sphingobium sp.]